MNKSFSILVGKKIWRQCGWTAVDLLVLRSSANRPFFWISLFSAFFRPVFSAIEFRYNWAHSLHTIFDFFSLFESKCIKGRTHGPYSLSQWLIFFYHLTPTTPAQVFSLNFTQKKFCDFCVLIVVSYISVFARRDKKPIWASVGSLGPRVMRFSIPGGVSIPTRSNHHFFCPAMSLILSACHQKLTFMCLSRLTFLTIF